jgi:hypothetical protein
MGTLWQSRQGLIRIASKLMVPETSPVSAVTYPKGKTMVVTKGTTNGRAIHNVDKVLDDTQGTSN